jgi:hypothetical protein
MIDMAVQREGRIYFVTPHSTRASDFLNGFPTESALWSPGYATERHSWLGKSLIIRRWELDGVISALKGAELDVARS